MNIIREIINLCKKFLQTQFIIMNDKDNLFRFLLTPSRWNFDEYCKDKFSTLNHAKLDLDPYSDNISVFLIENDLNSAEISNLEIISFLFSAAFRQSLKKICYIDILYKDIKNIGLKVRKNSESSRIKFPFFSEKHYEIYKVNNKKRIELADLIFSYINNNYSGELPYIAKSRMEELINIVYLDPRIKNIDYSKFYSWAKPI